MESRKTQYTKSVIRESFLSLLQEKPVEKITVTALCAKADINRSTFYAHYLDVYDLKEKLEQEFFQQMESLFHRTEWESFLPDMLSLLQKNAAFCKAVFGIHGDPAFLQRCVAAWMEPLPPNTPAEERWRLLFTINGASAVIADWIQAGMEVPPEKPAGTLNRLCSLVGGATAL